MTGHMAGPRLPSPRSRDAKRMTARDFVKRLQKTMGDRHWLFPGPENPATGRLASAKPLRRSRVAGLRRGTWRSAPLNGDEKAYCFSQAHHVDYMVS